MYYDPDLALRLLAYYLSKYEQPLELAAAVAGVMVLVMLGVLGESMGDE